MDRAAAEEPGSSWSGRLLVAGRALDTRIDGAPAVAGVLPVLAHLITDDLADPAGLTGRMRVWSSDEPHALWRPDRRGPLRIGQDGVAMARVGADAIEWFDPAHGIELWGRPASFGDALVRSQPASTPLTAWLAGSGIHVLHLGAVTIGGRAVLLIGSGGAGKSTTTLACGLAGAGFVGDDFCAVDLRDGVARVHSLFASAKLTPPADERLGRPDLPTLATTDEHKRVVLVHGSLAVERQAEVAAMIVLRPPGQVSTEPRPLAPTAALRALRTTGIKVALGAGSFADWMGAVMSMARTIPAYEMSLTWELDRVVEGVTRAASTS